jgi:hypothetical protein
LYDTDRAGHGKHKRLVIGAVMRKLLVLAYGILRSGIASTPITLDAEYGIYPVTITRGEEKEPQIVRPLRGCAGLAAMLAQPIGNAIPPAS